MLMLLSPAKALDWSEVDLDQAGVAAPTIPRLMGDTAVLMRKAKRLGPKDLGQLMGISDALARLNADRFHTMQEDVDPVRDRPAALAFNGDVYIGLGARTLGEDDLAWAQDHVAILSGLYGVLRPLDLIQPYRLEMGTALKTRRGSNLYQFWGDRVTAKLNAQLRGRSTESIVNLASAEYFRVVRKRKLRAPVITPVFWEESGGGAKPISFFAKRARGMMARYAIERRLLDPAQLKTFSGGGYRFRDDLGDATTWVFSRPKPPSGGGR